MTWKKKEQPAQNTANQGANWASLANVANAAVNQAKTQTVPRVTQAVNDVKRSFTSPKEKKTTSYTTHANTQNQQYVDQLNGLYGQMMGRGPFRYDLNSDMRYKQMADRYTQMGQQAMMDAMGQASAMTGGYGNSYAAQVGNQAYQQYLTALTDQVPSLYQQAYNVWSDENDRLLQLYQLAAQHPGILNELSPKSYTRTVTTEEPTEADTGTGKQYGYADYLQAVNSAAYDNLLKDWYYTIMGQKKE